MKVQRRRFGIAEAFAGATCQRYEEILKPGWHRAIFKGLGCDKVHL